MRRLTLRNVAIPLVICATACLNPPPWRGGKEAGDGMVVEALVDLGMEGGHEEGGLVPDADAFDQAPRQEALDTGDGGVGDGAEAFEVHDVRDVEVTPEPPLVVQGLLCPSSFGEWQDLLYRATVLWYQGILLKGE